MEEIITTLRRGLALILLCLPVLFAPSTALAEQNDLYAAEAPVNSEDAAARSDGIAQALSRVLVKLTGKRAIAGQPAVADLLGRASQFVQQFRYRLEDEPLSPAAPGPASQQRYIWVKFDKQALDRELRARGFPVWTTNRPRLLVWMAADTGRQRSLLNPETVPEASQAMTGRAAERGLPLRLPLLDLEDRDQLTVADLWSLYEENIRRASARYGEVVVLVGRLKSLGAGQWRAEWTLFDHQTGDSFQARGDLPALLADGMDQAMDRLAARYAPARSDGGPSPVLLRVSGLSDLPAYSQLMTMLGGLDGVEGLKLRHIKDADIWIELSMINGVEGLQRALTGNPVLQQESPGEPVPVTLPQVQTVSPVPAEPALPAADLRYRWL